MNQIPLAARLDFEAAAPWECGLPVRVDSKDQIVRSGKVLKEKLTDEAIPAIEAKRGISIVDAFKVAHQWRDAHMRPLLLVRRQLGTKLRNVENTAVSAARLKRMHSIRAKLAKRPLTLYQMQDIAGCRAIVGSNDEVARLVEFYHDPRSRHKVQSEDNYIERPKPDGYRSHHIILKFQGDGDDEIYNRQTVEVQLRTKAQHSWATAVEAIGLVRNENIKGGRGDLEWRRFFELMSSEIAFEENTALCPTTSQDRSEVRRELTDLSKKLRAVKNLESVNRSIKYFEDYGSVGADYYLLQYDYDAKSVSVHPYFDYLKISEAYVNAEQFQPRVNSVLVEVSQIQDLRTAFPNYFLDVQNFTDRLRSAIDPKTDSKSVAVRESARSKWDLSWLKGWR